MGLSKADTAVDEKGIVGLTWSGGDGKAGCLGELVTVTHYEGIEGVGGIKQWGCKGSISISPNLRVFRPLITKGVFGGFDNDVEFEILGT